MRFCGDSKSGVPRHAMASLDMPAVRDALESQLGEGGKGRESANFAALGSSQ